MRDARGAPGEHSKPLESRWMLSLASSSPSDWGRRAVGDMDEVLLDHAHCEKKAASTALSLIFRYPDHPALVVPLSQLAREELEHLELVVGHLRRRGREFERQIPSPYAAELVGGCRSHEPARLVDKLVCCALIEARSCERMQLLAEALEESGIDPELGALYRGLLASEARHHATYLDLARETGLVSEADLRARVRSLAQRESEIIARAPVEPRMHAG